MTKVAASTAQPATINIIAPEADTVTPKNRKRQNTIIAAVIVLLLLLLGAFAWGAIQSAINQIANNAQAQALLVDEFARKDDTTWDKLVRVDNVGTMPFVARISAAEFMQWITGNDWQSGQNIIEEITTFAPLIPSAETTMNAALDAPYGTLIDTQTVWFDVAPDMWSIRGLTNATSLIQAAPARGHAANGLPFSQYWNWTQPHVMTYAQWQSASVAERAHKWVLADDGYFYYTSIIRPDASSVPLMTAIAAASGFNPLHAAFYYAIDIQMEVVTHDDVATMKDGGITNAGNVDLRAASAEGKAILDSIDWMPPAIEGLTINGNDTRSITVGYGEPVTFSVDAGGTDGLTYLWQQATSPWDDAPGVNTQQTYVIDMNRAPGTYEFRVLVSNSGDAPVENDGHTAASDVLTVRVNSLPPQAPVGALPTRQINSSPADRFVFDNIPFWRIATTTDGSDTYDLLVTQYVYYDAVETENNRFNQEDAHGNFWLRGATNTTRSTLMMNMDTWWNDNAGPQLRERVVAPVFSGILDAAVPANSLFGVEHASGQSLGNSVSASFANTTFETYDNRSQSRPSATMVAEVEARTNPATGGGIIAFPLSGLEVVNYFPDGVNDARDGFVGGRATDDTQLGFGAYDNAARTTLRYWWLRSRGWISTNPVRTSIVIFDETWGAEVWGSWGTLESSVTNTGWSQAMGSSILGVNRGIRPALWVLRTP
ncbi:MAG: hypothetical protein FWG78_02440 [Coriobacteriia bacterium]|nr:hypothetical protein [Coriobacteriia bacterium]